MFEFLWGDPLLLMAGENFWRRVSQLLIIRRYVKIQSQEIAALCQTLKHCYHKVYQSLATLS
jgi:hypothetical protein